MSSVVGPRQTKLVDVVVVDLVERAEALLVVGAAHGSASCRARCLRRGSARHRHRRADARRWLVRSAATQAGSPSAVLSCRASRNARAGAVASGPGRQPFFLQSSSSPPCFSGCLVAGEASAAGGRPRAVETDKVLADRLSVGCCGRASPEVHSSVQGVHFGALGAFGGAKRFDKIPC